MGHESSAIHIREALIRDVDGVRALYLSAFSEVEGEIVADVAVNLLVEKSTPETISLVAELNDQLVGHIAFSPVMAAERHRPVGYLLAPLAVHPEFQRQGVGAKLVEAGIERLSLLSVKIVFVYGDPKYYGRFGFEDSIAASYEPPYPLQHPGGWQARILSDRNAIPAAGKLSCVGALQDPQLW